MADDEQDKQHKATGKRLSELKKRGNVMRSRDLSGGLIFVVTVALFFILSKHIVLNIKNNFIASFTGFRNILFDPNYLVFILKHLLLNSMYELLPIFAVIFAATLLSPFLFGGWNFTLDVIQFKLTKLNPMDNLSRLFSLKNSFAEILRSMLKSSVFFLILTFYFLSRKSDMIDLVNLPIQSAIHSGLTMINSYILILSGSLIFVVLVDVIYHYYRYQEESKMSTQDIKDEHKESEGNPEVKRKLRFKQIALIRQRLDQIVPKANVIVTNPTHYAVALKYDGGNDRAPKVIAKGKDLIAYQIKKIAMTHAITIYESPALARAIYHTTKIGSPIHPGLYKAVAIVLSYVYQLKNYQLGKGSQPQYISNLEIPNELVYRE